MSSLWLLFIGLAMLAGGYLLYAKFLGERIYRLDPAYATPAHEMNDGVDFVPTNKFVLWGHHFTSVAGAAPIVGPAVAVIWGWLPAFLWVTLGTVFFAGMHDMGALWASTRNRGRSMGMLSGRYIGARGRNLFLVVIFLLLLMVVAAFAVVIKNLLISTPSAVIPAWGAIVVALVVGQMIYRWRMNLLLTTVIGVTALYSLILLGDAYPVELPASTLGMSPATFWIVALFVYAGIASLLPVWVLLQPRDYINGVQLFIGLGLLYGATLLSAPDLAAPALNDNVPEGTPSLVPLLFVTIACGAISGFHGMVSSGTSSKQLDKETDARFVGYFGAVGEGLLALGAIIAATAGYATLADWEAVYTEFNADYWEPPVYTFAHVFFNAERRGDEEAREGAIQLLTELNERGVPFSGAPGLGDRPLYFQNYIERTRDFVESNLGPDLTSTLDRVEPSSSTWPLTRAVAVKPRDPPPTPNPPTWLTR